jgi:hypothetical protein
LTSHRSINRRYATLARELGLDVASVKAEAPIVCGLCAQPFEPEEPED